jgi:hypothetical protein
MKTIEQVIKDVEGKFDTIVKKYNDRLGEEYTNQDRAMMGLLVSAGFSEIINNTDIPDLSHEGISAEEIDYLIEASARQKLNKFMAPDNSPWGIEKEFKKTVEEEIDFYRGMMNMPEDMGMISGAIGGILHYYQGELIRSLKCKVAEAVKYKNIPEERANEIVINALNRMVENAGGTPV